MSETFKKPPLQLLPHCIEYNFRHSPDHPVIVYASSDLDVNTITWSKAVHAFARAVRVVNVPNFEMKAGESPPIVALLANIDSITYYSLEFGLLVAGYIVFPISLKNSPAAISHLLKKTGTKILVVSDDEPTSRLATAALAIVLEDGHEVDVLPAPSFQDIFPKDSKDTDMYPFPAYPGRDWDSPALILHSSGTTAFPKPITLTHRTLLQWSKNKTIVGLDMSRMRLALHALPVYHAMATAPFSWAVYEGTTLSGFPPQTPPITPSSTNFLSAAMASECTVMLTIPLFLEIWNRNAEDVEKLRRFDAVLFSGGPLDKAPGEELSQAGVVLVSLYGSTETGPLSLIAPTRGNPDWAWTDASRDMDIRFISQGGDSDMFEVVILESPEYTPAVINSVVEGQRAFSTNDLVVLHPNDHKKFKISGRKDDQLMLSTGEKTNPGPLEAIISRNPLVQCAVMFGRGRMQNGVIIQPAAGQQIDPADELALSQFRNKIWPSIEEANDFAPTHSRLYKEMILVAHPSKPFEMTAKFTPRRAFVLAAYKDEIEAIYGAVEASVHSAISLPSQWTRIEVYEYVRKIVHHFMETPIGNDDDIFNHGGDSLKATFIRNSFIFALRRVRKFPAAGISQDFVYANPSITRLAQALSATVETSPVADRTENISKLSELEDMIAEFSVNYPDHQPSMHQNDSQGDIVLLTGTTGGLGSQLLAHLMSLPDVYHVYALNRRAAQGDKTLRERQTEAFAHRGLDTTILESEKVTLVEGDTALDGLGIPPSLFEEIRCSITLIIHNAWRLNFNMGLSSYKPIILGVLNLTRLALLSPQRAPPRFIFTSSVSIFKNHKGPGKPLEAKIEDPRQVLSNGYAESKFVGERILEHAGKSTPLRPIIVRIGQLSSNASGAWNSGDWLPAMVRSGQVLGVLPGRDNLITWISMEAAARAIVDFRTSEYQYLHLAHPNPVAWNTIFDAFSAILNVPLVSWSEWFSRLEADKSGPISNPAAHLLEFFRAIPAVSLENFEAGTPMLDLTQALKASPSLADPSLPQLGRADVERWIAYWKRKGTLSK